MTNIFFEDEIITKNDLYFLCYMIERVARTLKQPNKYVVNAIGYEELAKKISLASVLHSENPAKVAADFIEEYHLEKGNFDITDINPELVDKIPTEHQIGKVYKRLILDTLEDEEDYVNGLIRIYNAPICEIIDDYNSSAYYEPSYVIARAYHNNSFN